MSATPGVVKPSIRRFAVRVLKLVISVFYWVLNRSRAQWRRIRGEPCGGACVVLYYHSVPAAYRQRFEKQMNLVASRGTAIDLRTMEANPASGNVCSVAITFDDALESFADNAVPVLERLNLPATVFAVADAMGSQPLWGESYFSPDERVMSTETLRSLPKNIAVGSHTLTHRDLAALSSREAAREIGESRQLLEAMVGRPVTLFSFPFGAVDDSTVRQCCEAGYKRVFTTEPELLAAGSDAFAIGRVAADPWDWRLEFRLKIAGAYCWQPWVRAVRRKISARFLSAPHGFRKSGSQDLIEDNRGTSAMSGPELRGVPAASRASTKLS